MEDPIRLCLIVIAILSGMLAAYRTEGLSLKHRVFGAIVGCIALTLFGAYVDQPTEHAVVFVLLFLTLFLTTNKRKSKNND